MMLIDAHVHLFPEALFKAIWGWFDRHGWVVKYKVFAEEVVRLLREKGVDRFIVLNYAHKAGMSESLNAWTYEFCKKIPEAIPFGAVHFDDDVPSILKKCFLDYGFKGIKFHAHVAAIRPDDRRMFPIYEQIIEHDRILTLHAGNGPSLKGYKENTSLVSGVRYVREVLKRYPDLRMIMPHLGAEECDEFFALMEEFPNLWMDTTMICSGYFPLKVPWEKVEKFQDRILYGTDFPNIPYDMGKEAEGIQNSPLSEEAKGKILGINATKFLAK